MNYETMTDDEFRLVARKFTQDNYPENLRYPASRLPWEQVKVWYRTLSAAGWLAPAWPVEYGGMGLSASKQIILIEEQETWGVGRLPDQGIVTVGPLLIEEGTEQQRSYYLPKILAGEHIWCQGYSEPNSGSDLASLQTEAAPTDGGFILCGTKIWTSLAQDATHMFLLAKTSKGDKPQRCISFLLLDLKSPGVTVRPIKTLGGHEEFCQVFLDSVMVPTAGLVGRMNEGWRIAKKQLGFERLFVGSPKTTQHSLGLLRSVARTLGRLEDPVFVDRLVQLEFDVADQESLYRRFTTEIMRGGKLTDEVSILKIWTSETYCRIAETMLELCGVDGAADRMTHLGGHDINILQAFYNSRATTIYGGSNEIQRNIVARSILELPSF
jgi:hypothetical protein